MDMRRLLVLGVAIVAAIAAIFLVRGMLGGGTPKATAMIAPPQMPTTDVLVASAAISPGTSLNASMVHWQAWPRSSVDSTFVTREGTPDLEVALKGTVSRAPLVEGEPLSTVKFVHSDAAGFMAATLTPGMRAVSIPITVESGAGGFILPNDRVDLLMTELISDNPKRYSAHTVLSNVRVLATDQTFKEDKDQKFVLAKTATLEVSPSDARLVARSQAAGPITLMLRPLGDSIKTVTAANAPHTNEDSNDGNVTVIRFGLVATGASGRK